ncbi:MAG: hypothetical protein ACK5TD_00040, partial [bacterium]
RVGRPADFRLIYTLLVVTMSQKSSVIQIANLVPYALTPDNPGRFKFGPTGADTGQGAKHP